MRAFKPPRRRDSLFLFRFQEHSSDCSRVCVWLRQPTVGLLSLQRDASATSGCEGMCCCECVCHTVKPPQRRRMAKLLMQRLVEISSVVRSARGWWRVWNLSVQIISLVSPRIVILTHGFLLLRVTSICNSDVVNESTVSRGHLLTSLSSRHPPPPPRLSVIGP